MRTLAKTIAAIAASLMAFGCAPKPDASLVLWEQPSPQIAAIAHAREIGGQALYVLPTGSMEPYLTGGDWIVLDRSFPFEKLVRGDLVTYQASWRPPTAPVVTHVAAAKQGDGWIMDGIANEHYEKNGMRMVKADYRGKIVQVYTKRVKP